MANADHAPLTETQREIMLDRRMRRAIRTNLLGKMSVVAMSLVLLATASFDTVGLNAEPPARPAVAKAAGPRVLWQLGTNDLQLRDFVTDLALSRDGKTIVATAANGETPSVWLFDAQTGRENGRVLLPNQPAGRAQCVALSPDNAQLVWGEWGQDGGFLTVWDQANQRLLFREKCHRRTVKAVTFSPDGELIASAGEEGTVQLRRARNPAELVREIVAHAAPRQAGAVAVAAEGGSGGTEVVFSPDGSRLIIGTSDRLITVWRVADGRQLRRIENAGPWVRIAVTPDGRRIMSSGARLMDQLEPRFKFGHARVQRPEIRFWDIESGELVKEFIAAQELGFGEAAISPDGKKFARADFGALRIIDAESGATEQTTPLPGSWGGKLIFSADGARVAMAMGRIALFDARTGERLLYDPRTFLEGIASADWSPAGDRIVTGHEDGTVRLWDGETGAPLWDKLLAPVIAPSGWRARPWAVQFSSDGRRVVAVGRRDDPIGGLNGIVAVYWAATGQLIREIPLREIRHAALSHDGKTVVAATTNGGADDTHLIGIDPNAGKTLYTVPPAEQRGGLWMMKAMQFEPRTSTLVVALADSNVVRFDGLTGKELSRFLADGRTPEEKQQQARQKILQTWNAAMSRDGRILATNVAESVYLWDLTTGKLLRRIRHPHDHGCNLCVSSDGKTLATADLQYVNDLGQDTVRLYDVETGDQIQTLEPDDNRAHVLAFSSDGTKLFTGYHRGAATVWDVRREE